MDAQAQPHKNPFLGFILFSNTSSYNCKNHRTAALMRYQEFNESSVLYYVCSVDLEFTFGRVITA